MSLVSAKACEDAVLAVAWPRQRALLTGCIPGSTAAWEIADAGAKAPLVKKAADSSQVLGVRALVHGGAGDVFVSVGLHDGLLLLHTQDCKVIARSASDSVQEATCAAWDPRRAGFAVGTRRGTVRLLRVAENLDDGTFAIEEEADVPLCGALVMGLAFDPSGTLLVAVDAEGGLAVLDVDARAKVAAVAASPSALRAVDWARDGREIYAAGDDHRVLVYDASGLAAGSPSPGLPLIAALSGHTGFLCAAVASPDRPLVATGGNDRTVRVWDARKRECIASVDGLPDKVWSLAWSPDGKQLAIGTEAGTVSIWTPPLV
jgi:WD40 repeat protein